jgi:hypothetical protein
MCGSNGDAARNEEFYSAVVPAISPPVSRARWWNGMNPHNERLMQCHVRSSTSSGLYFLQHDGHRPDLTEAEGEILLSEGLTFA